jgi:hypothetical protein
MQDAPLPSESQHQPQVASGTTADSSEGAEPKEQNATDRRNLPTQAGDAVSRFRDPRIYTITLERRISPIADRERDWEARELLRLRRRPNKVREQLSGLEEPSQPEASELSTNEKAGGEEPPHGKAR